MKEYRSVPVRSLHDARAGASMPPPGAEASSTGANGSDAVDADVSRRNLSVPSVSANLAIATSAVASSSLRREHHHHPEGVPSLSSHGPSVSGKPRSDVTPAAAVRHHHHHPQPLSMQRPPSVVVNLENFEQVALPHPLKTVFNSPRSLSVCAEFGIHVTELIPRAPQDFLAPNIPETIAAMRYHHFESRRQEKLAALRAARADLIVGCLEEIAAASPSRGVGDSTLAINRSRGDGNVENANNRSIATSQDLPNKSGTTTSRPTGTERPVLSRSRARDPRTGPLARHVDPLLAERYARRDLVYERAMKSKLEKEQAVVQRQLLQEQRAAAHRRACEIEKLKVIEMRRLKWSDAREKVEHKKRQEEYRELRRHASADGRSRSAGRSSSVPRSFRSSTPQSREGFASASMQRLQVLLAKEAYFTPRQREEKTRAMSANR